MEAQKISEYLVFHYRGTQSTQSTEPQTGEKKKESNTERKKKSRLGDIIKLTVQTKKGKKFEWKERKWGH